MIKGKPCTICKNPDDYSDETVCHNCIGKWKKVLERKERKKVLIEVGESLDKYKGLSSHQKMKLFKYFGLNPLEKDFGLL